jgi:hypothetical protein
LYANVSGSPDPETKALFLRNPPDTWQAHLTGIERQAEISRRNAPRETKMSMLESLGRYGAAIRKAREVHKSRRLLNSLPPEIQKDIGWPVSPRSNERAALTGTNWGAAR